MGEDINVARLDRAKKALGIVSCFGPPRGMNRCHDDVSRLKQRGRHVETTVAKDVDLNAVKNRTHAVIEGQCTRLSQPEWRRQAALNLRRSAVVGDREKLKATRNYGLRHPVKSGITIRPSRMQMEI
jgi:hypothetical protein